MRLRKKHNLCFWSIVSYCILYIPLYDYFSNFTRTFPTFFMKLLEAINLRWLINNKNANNGYVFVTLSKTPLMYFKKNINKTRKLYEILVFIFLSWFSCLSMTNWIFWSVKKDFVQDIKFLLIFNLTIWKISYIFEIWSNAPLIFINNTAANFFSSHFSHIKLIKIVITLIANLFFWLSICPRYSLE